MNEEIMKSLIDICFKAKHITEMMPELPHGMKPRHIHVIESIYRIGKHQNDVRISDVSQNLSVTMPSITKLVNELVTLKLVRKSADIKDKRVTTLTLTPQGMNYYDIYIKKYYTKLASMCNISESDIKIVGNAIDQLLHAVNITKKEQFLKELN